MRPGRNRYESWTEEQLQERFGNIEEKMEALSLDSLIQQYQQRVEQENAPGSFFVDAKEVDELKEEIANESLNESSNELPSELSIESSIESSSELSIESSSESSSESSIESSIESSSESSSEPSFESTASLSEDADYETKDYYMTKEDFERLRNDDGKIPVDGQRLHIEDVAEVSTSELQDEEVPFIQLDSSHPNSKHRSNRRDRRRKLRANNESRSRKH